MPISHAPFCHNGASWGPWDDSLYDLTPCFRETILDGSLPFLVSILSLACLIAYSRFHIHTAEDVPAPLPDRATRIRRLVLILIDSLQFLQWIFLLGWRIAHMPVVGHFSVTAAFLACIAWAYFFYLHLQPSPPHSTRRLDLHLAHSNLFYFTTFVASLIRLRSNGRILFLDTTVPYTSPLLEFILSILSAASIAIALVDTISTPLRGYSISLQNHKDHKGHPRQLSSEVNASLWHWLTFSWIGPLIRLGSRKTIDESDLWGLGFMMQSRKLWRDFRQSTGNTLRWNLFASNRRDVMLQTLFATLLVFVEYATPFFLNKLLNTLEQLTALRSGSKEAANAVERGYLFVFGMLVSQVLRTLCAGQMFYFGRRTDVRIKAMLQAEVFWKAERRRDFSGVTRRNTEGDDAGDELGGQGRLVNLMSVDSQRVSQVASVIYHVYTSPMLICVGGFFLYRLLGMSSLFGLMAMVFTIPINSYVSRRYKKLQAKLMASRDRRISLTTEIFHMIRLVKLMGWSPLYTQRVLDARERELKDLMRSFLQNAMLTLLWYSSPIITTVLAFLSYTKFEGRSLTASVAFTSITVFDKLRSPLNALPEVLVSLISANVSLKRLESFLGEQEVEPPSDLPGEEIIGFTDSASFRWFGSDPDAASFGTGSGIHSPKTDTQSLPPPNETEDNTDEEDEDEGFMLRELDIQFPKGELSLVCGPTGSGKSSLLSALLGEMERVRGYVHLPRVWLSGSFDEVEALTKRQKKEQRDRENEQRYAAHLAKSKSNGNGQSQHSFHEPTKPTDLYPYSGRAQFDLNSKGIAYVAQQAWLQNASIKDNILFGESYHHERYNTVLHACALTKDLEMFEDRDETEIGEKGITLSGGQKQRVSLARAVYSRAPILLLDDVLSAVDASTAAHIFDHCLTDPQLMAGRTRILVTHHYFICAPGASLMLQMNEGFVVGQGLPKQVIADFGLQEMPMTQAEIESHAINGASGTNVQRTIIVEEDSEANPSAARGLGITTNVESFPIADNSITDNETLPEDSAELAASTVVASTISRVSSTDGQSSTISENADDPPIYNRESVIESSDDDSAVIDEDDEDVTGDEENRRRRAAAAGSKAQRSKIRRASSTVGGSIGGTGSLSNEGSMSDRRASVVSVRKRDARKLIKEEKRAKGKVKWSIYTVYINAAGGLLYVVSVLFLLMAVRSLNVGEGLWLKVWSGAYHDHYGNSSSADMRSSSAVASLGTDSATSSWYDHDSSSSMFTLMGQHMTSQQNPFYFGTAISPTSSLFLRDASIDVGFYFGIYALITLGSILVQVLRLLIQYWGSLKASRVLYEEALQAVVRGTFRFFDTTPIGRLQNRFARDFEIVDSNLSGDVGAFLTNMIAIVSVILVVVTVVPQFLIAAAFIALLYRKIGKLYINTSREVKRLESNSRSPIFSFFGEALVGIATVRAFGAQRRFMLEMLNRIDSNLRAYYLLWACNRWLSLRADIIGSSVSFLTGMFIVTFHDRIDPGLAGLSLSMAVSLLQQINFLVRRYTTLEMNLNAIERVDEIIKNPQEPPDIIEGSRPPAAWPTEGNIVFDHVTLSYAPELTPVLRDVTFTIQQHEKVGIVGRTGSGKSTTASALFRVVDPLSGSILIDGIDVTKIGVQDLRSRLSIITQDSQLFSGTIRSNLDPFGEFEDREIWDSLRRVRLVAGDDYFNYDGDDVGTSGNASPALSAKRPMIRRRISSPRFRGRSEDNVSIRSLETPVSEEGQNFSLGQRQLLCMARALLRRSKIIVMDEATASVDYQTDSLIQKTIREEFSDCTIVCIAHRLETVIDYDKILVLDHGRVIEYDSPKNLLRHSSSFFYKMCQHTGATEFRRLQQLAR